MIESIKDIAKIIKNESSTGPVAIAMRLEVGMPFLLLDWPAWLFVGIIFVLINDLAEKTYNIPPLLRNKLWRLWAYCLLNGIVLVFAHMLLYPPIYPHNQKFIYCNSSRVIGNIGLFLAVTSIMILERTIFIFIEHYMFTSRKKKN